MANLHFHYGVMGSSKSAKLIIEAYNFRKNGNLVEVIKPAFDKRFAQSEVISRAGDLSVPAVAMNNLDDYNIAQDTNVLLVDEVQFFSPKDIDKLVKILHKLADSGNSILIIEHNLDIIKCADHIIDLGPEGGDGGGSIVAQGTPTVLSKCKESYTGKYLKRYFGKK